MAIAFVRSSLKLAPLPLLLVAGWLQAGTLTPPGMIAPTGVTTQQIYDSVQGIATANGDTGERTPGTAIAQPATMTVTPVVGKAFTTNIYAYAVQFTRPTDPATGQATGKVTFDGFTVTRDSGANTGQFFFLMMNNVNLTSVVLTLSTTPVVTFTITNARIASFHPRMSQRPGGSYAEIEDIGITFAGGKFTISDGTDSGVFDRTGP